MGNTGASGGMSPRRPQTRVRSGAYLGGSRPKSNPAPESHSFTHPLPGTVWDSWDSWNGWDSWDSWNGWAPGTRLLQIVLDFLGQLGQGQGRGALGLVVGGDPDLAAGLEGLGGHPGESSAGLQVLDDQLVERLVALLGGLVE